MKKGICAMPHPGTHGCVSLGFCSPAPAPDPGWSFVTQKNPTTTNPSRKKKKKNPVKNSCGCRVPGGGAAGTGMGALTQSQARRRFGDNVPLSPELQVSWAAGPDSHGNHHHHPCPPYPGHSTFLEGSSLPHSAQKAFPRGVKASQASAGGDFSQTCLQGAFSCLIFWRVV